MDRRKRHGVQRPQTTALWGTRVASSRLQSTLCPADRRIKNGIGSGAQSTRTRQTWCEHPLAYASRKLSPTERNYSTIEQECLAIKWGIDKFAIYLLGRQFDVETDHAPLKWLGDHQHNTRVARWALVPQPFDFIVAHRRGRENINDDVLSRREVWTLWSNSARQFLVFI